MGNFGLFNAIGYEPLRQAPSPNQLIINYTGDGTDERKWRFCSG